MDWNTRPPCPMSRFFTPAPSWRTDPLSPTVAGFWASRLWGTPCRSQSSEPMKQSGESVSQGRSFEQTLPTKRWGRLLDATGVITDPARLLTPFARRAGRVNAPVKLSELHPHTWFIYFVRCFKTH